MRKRIERFREYLEVSKAHEIARRLFVMNAFDGTLTIMGVVIGAHFSGVTDPRVVIIAGIGGSVAMGISGISGAYLTERAERKRDLKKLEMAMLRRLDGTQFARASEFASFVIAFVDGISPAISAAILVMPYFFVPGISMDTAFYISLSLGLTELFTLGVFLARISDEKPLLSGIQMIIIGVITIIIVSLLAI
ncbi:MAG TPA: VIT1/CCC1 transporter family protein [Methanotrichaceae archaeon]|nr:VIT1/CCC1 transporter family protein [Methanotrichaceae archaeon]